MHNGTQRMKTCVTVYSMISQIQQFSYFKGSACFISKVELQREWERDRTRSSIPWLTPNAGNPEFQPGLPCGDRDQSTVVIFHCFPSHINRELKSEANSPNRHLCAVWAPQLLALPTAPKGWLGSLHYLKDTGDIPSTNFVPKQLHCKDMIQIEGRILELHPNLPCRLKGIQIWMHYTYIIQCGRISLYTR